MRKRFLATLLALAMVLSVTPFALADNGGEDNGVTSQAAKELPDAENGVITLTEDVTLSTAYEVTEGNVIIDLAGYTLAYDGTGKVFLDVQGGSLTIRDSGGKGEVKVNEPYDGTGTDGKTQWIKCVQVHAGATFTLEGGTLTNTNTAFEATQVISNYGTTYIKGGTVKGVTGIFIYNPVRGNDEWINYVSTCNVSGGSIVGVAPTTYQGSNQYGNSSVADLNWSYGIAIYGPGMDSNGAVDNNKSVLNIRGGTITAGQAIGTNASSGRYAGYTINMSGGTVDGGTGTGMYLPAIGETNISGGTVKGAQAIRIAAGELNITDGTIIGTSLMSENTDLISGGSGGTEGAIVVGKASSGYVGDVDITISNGAIITNTAEGNGDAIRPAIVVSDKNMSNETMGYDDLSITVNVDGATITGDVVKVSNLSGGNTQDGGNTSLVIENATVTGNVSNQSKTGLTVKDSTITGNVTNTSEGSTALLNTTVQGDVTDGGGAGSIYDDRNPGQTGNVVAINETTSKTYTSLQDALTAAKDGDTIVLLADITNNNVGTTAEGADTVLNINKSITIKGNGNEISINLSVPDTFGDRDQVFSIGEDKNSTVAVTLDNVKMTVTGKDNGKGDAFDVWGTLNITNGSAVTINGVQSAFTMQGGSNAKINVDSSEVSVSDVNGNFSNGGEWTIENNSTVTIDGTGTHGLSVEKVTIDNSKVTVDNAGWVGVYGSEITLNKGAVLNVTNSATDSAIGDSYKDKGAVQLKSDTGSITVKEGATLTLSGNGNDAEGQQSIYVGKGTLTNNGTIKADKVIYDTTSGTEFSVTVTNNGEVVDSGTTSGGQYTLPAAPTRPGYVFNGWQGSDGKIYDANETVTVSSNMTFTAQWSVYVAPNPSYLVSVNQAQGGKVTANPTAAKKGDTVTLTVTPEDGYELAGITVTDFWGKDVALTANGDGTYSFTMPASQVEIEASFTQTGEPEPELPFTDVTEADWFYDEVQYVVDNGLMIGVSDTEFAPGANLTRAMMWTILARMDGETITGANWAQDARAWAMANGVSDGTDADDAVTREQLVTMIWRYVGEPQGTGDLSGFADADTVSSWAEEAMSWSVGAGLIQGDENGLTPTATAIRAQIAAILMRFCENVAK